uniref:Large ribosomal subunit protein mL40 n=1 Tax=Parastrongyloides trichosuri TaxID=131310 RepID=A0A0N4ZNH6_PARTI
MLRVSKFFSIVTNCRNVHTTPLLSSSVFMKRQKRMDPEMAKQRETRKRKKLEKEIRLLQKNSKKPKPIDEMSLPESALQNISERYRTLEELSSKSLKDEILIHKEYNSLQTKLWRIDDEWIQKVNSAQEKALDRLKVLSPSLHAAAIELDETKIKFNFQGPPQTQFKKNYEAPDGDFIDVTKKWT